MLYFIFIILKVLKNKGLCGTLDRVSPTFRKAAVFRILKERLSIVYRVQCIIDLKNSVKLLEKYNSSFLSVSSIRSDRSHVLMCFTN